MTSQLHGSSKRNLGPNKSLLIEAIKRKYAEEGSLHIAKEFGYLPEQVMRVAWKLGIKTNQKKTQRAARLHNDPDLVRDYFKTWSSGMAYTLGYIYADGAIKYEDKYKTYGLRLECHETDEEILKYLLDEFKTTRKLGTLTRLRKGVVRVTRYCQIYDQTFLLPLIELHGLEPNKSYKNLPLPKIPDSLFCHFFRGHFDGDGCAAFAGRNKKAVRITSVGSELFIQQLRERVNDLLGTSGQKVRESSAGGCYHASWQSRKDVTAIANWMYPISFPFGLGRKHSRLLPYLRP